MRRLRNPDLRIAVIGAGPVGIAAGRELLRRGFRRFTIFEKEAAAGGTWHIHSYPGLACDVKAHAYTFSSRPNPEWSANYVEQAEIEAYLQDCAREFGIEPHLRLRSRVVRAVYGEDGTWTLTLEGGSQESFDVVINAMGNQHTPIYPDLVGRERFRGEAWHATCWNHDVDLKGKKVTVIGSAASAVQIVPELAKVVGHLHVIQRSPNWILPRGKKPFKPVTRALLRFVPGIARLFRAANEKLMNLSHTASIVGESMMDRVEKMGRDNLAQSISDPALREALTPRSRFGCKRPLLSDDFYPALVRGNVTLVPSAAKEVTETGIVTEGGIPIDADVIVYCTGYQVLDFERIDVRGVGGRSLGDVMKAAPEAYKGVSVPGFPNYFLGVGPNGVLLSASFFTAAELNIRQIVKLLSEMDAAGAREISVKPALHRAYNDWIASARDGFSWAASSCDSYYRLPSGHTPFLFPGDIKLFKKQRAEAGLHEYDVG
jgi:cation diffusion facilitator CzcD-associated flavoprotein CzcO